MEGRLLVLMIMYIFVLHVLCGYIGWGIFIIGFIRVMPRRRDKRTDTENSDDYEENQNMDRVTHFGAVQINRLLAPDQVEGDDASKYSILAWSNTLNAQRLLPWP